jgi:AraC-like DNA-binding protein
LIFAKVDLLRPFDTANNPLWEAMLPTLQAQLVENDTEDPLMASVQETLMANVARADDSLASVGIQLGMSPRSLQREFGRRHTTYKKLLAHAKQMLAINYVRNFHLPLAEVAYLLGYSEPSAFSRAFRQWTGIPFSQYQLLQA